MSRICIKENKDKLIKLLKKSYKYNENNSKNITLEFAKDKTTFPIKMNISSYSDKDYASIVVKLSADKINIDNNVMSFNFIFDVYRDDDDIVYGLATPNDPSTKDWITVINCYMKDKYNKSNYLDIKQDNYKCKLVNNEYVINNKYARTIDNHVLFRNVVVILKLLINIIKYESEKLLKNEEGFNKFVKKFKKNFKKTAVTV